MKKSLLGVVLASIVILAAACDSFSNRGTVDKPFIGSASSESLSFESIELTDSATILNAVVHFRPGWWIRIAPTSAIVAGGQTYTVESADGIVFDEQATMPDSGVLRFTMKFPAIPADVRSIDFTEGTEDGWKLWDIDLTGNARHDMYQSGLPAKLRRDTSRPMPETMLAYGDSTTVRVHIMGYKPEMGRKLQWAVNTIAGQRTTDNEVPVSDDGIAVVKMALSAPGSFFIIGLDNIHSLGTGSFLVAPGETMDVYADTHLSGIFNMATRDGREDYWPEGYSDRFTDGLYPDLRQNTGGRYYDMGQHSSNFADYHFDGDRYTDYVINLYKANIDSIDADSSLTDMGRRYSKAKMMADLIDVTVDAERLMKRNYYVKTGAEWGSPIPADSVPVKLSAENVRAIAENIDFNNLDIILTGYLNTDIEVWENAGIDPGFLKIANLHSKAYGQAENGRLDPSLADSLRALCEPLADEVVAHNAAIKARIEAIGMELVSSVPDVAPDKVLDAILAPHKGKVVIVDLWNTWCGPCRAAIANNEPEKSGDLSSDDIVWIYIANQSSPTSEYLTAIKDIKGIHYQVEDDQWKAITDRFNVDGIPYYILVDRKGNATGRPDLRNHTLFKKTILDTIAE